jgi:hypothetical protein
MAGNLCEESNGWYECLNNNTLFSGSPQGPATGAFQVTQGGSWGEIKRYIRDASRIISI